MDIIGLQASRRNRRLREALETMTGATPPPTTTLAAARQTAQTSGPGQPHEADHPGSDVYAYSGFTVGTYRLWHFQFFNLYPTIVTYLIPKGSVPLSSFPVVAVSPGKFLDRYDWYAALLQHICRKGYVVLFVDADTGPLDCQHSRQAREFLQAIRQTLVNRVGGRVASPPQVAWWGHSIGAKVQALAAQMKTDRNYLKPAAVIANNFSNDKALCNDDALPGAPFIPADIAYTLIRGDRDDISGGDPARLYGSLRHLQRCQLITAISYPEDGLQANHEAPLTEPSLFDLNALDWWLYWKIAVGAFDFHFKKGPDKWAYGSERENGGTDAAGNRLRHRVEP